MRLVIGPGGAYSPGEGRKPAECYERASGKRRRALRGGSSGRLAPPGHRGWLLARLPGCGLRQVLSIPRLWFHRSVSLSCRAVRPAPPPSPQCFRRWLQRAGWSPTASDPPSGQWERPGRQLQDFTGTGAKTWHPQTGRCSAHVAEPGSLPGAAGQEGAAGLQPQAARPHPGAEGTGVSPRRESLRKSLHCQPHCLRHSMLPKALEPII